MELLIIDETSGNPFEYFPDDGQPEIGFPRNYGKQESLDKIMKTLSEKLGFEDRKSCLEVGAGHNQSPSQALSKLGNKVYTLDADWSNDRHTYITFEKLSEMKRDSIPLLGGKNGEVSCYMGDIAFLDDKKSELREDKFDLIYFWGSIFSDGICSSVSQSRKSKEHKIDIKLKDRILKIIPSINIGGTLLAVSGIFTGYFKENIDDLSYFNRRLTDLALYLINYGEKPVKRMGLIVASREAIKRRHNTQQSKIEGKLFVDPITQIIKLEDYSLFGKENNYENLRKAATRINRNSLENIGEVDAFFIQYA